MKIADTARDFLKQNDRILKYFKPYWKLWLLIFVMANILTLLELVNPLIVQFLIDVVLIEKNFDMLNLTMFAFVIIGMVVIAIRYVYAYLQRRLSLGILYDVRNQLFRHIEYMDTKDLHEKSLGDFLSRITDDIEAIGQYVSLILDTLLLNALMVAIILSMCVMLHWQLTLIALFIIPFVVISQKHYGNMVRTIYEKLRKADASLLDFLQERLSLMSLIKIFSKEHHELEKEKQKAKELIKIDLKMVKTENFVAVVVGMLIFYSLLFVLWYGGTEVIRGVLTIGALVAVYTYIGMLFGPVQTLADLNIDLQQTLVSVNRVFSILDIKPKIVDRKGAKKMDKVKGAISFKKVSFGYEEGKPVLRNISFDIKPGEIVGFVGTSGSGKSTIARLLTRLYDADSGTVAIDNEDIRNIKLESLRKNIAYIKQDTLLFNASIEENISYGKPEAAKDEIIRAAKLARAHDFIMKNPKKYKTIIGAEGTEFSGGEQQRISIARGILKDSRILLLDEATSALDVETEMAVQNSLKEVSKGKTVIIIAHRLSTLNIANRIFVLDKGRIVEKGTFSELMQKKGLFYNIYNLQMKKMEEM